MKIFISAVILIMLSCSVYADMFNHSGYKQGNQVSNGISSNRQQTTDYQTSQSVGQAATDYSNSYSQTQTVRYGSDFGRNSTYTGASRVNYYTED